MNDSIDYILLGIILVMMIRGTHESAKHKWQMAQLRSWYEPNRFPPPLDYRTPVPWRGLIAGASLVALYILAHVFA